MAEITAKTTKAVPAGARRPQDRKPKDNPDGSQTFQVQGLEVTIDPAVFDDWELLDDLARADAGELIAGVGVMRKIVGAAQLKAVMNHLRNPDTGRVPVESAENFIKDLFGAFRPNP